MKKRILVTGASGFIGRQVLLALQGCGDEIHSVYHTARAMSDSRHHAVNLLDPDRTDRLIQRVQPTHLLHLAWYAEHGKYWESPQNVDWLAGSIRLFQLFVENGGRRAVFAGTCAEYDWSAPSPLHEEHSASHPSTLYGICKNSLRQIVAQLAKQSQVTVVWARIFFAYGPGEHPARLVPSIFDALRNDRPAVVHHGDHVRNQMHVSDLARALVHLLHSPAEGIINVAGSETHALGDVARMVGEITGKSHLLRIEKGQDTPANPRVLTADISRLLSLGWVPRYSLAAGLKKMNLEFMQDVSV